MLIAKIQNNQVIEVADYRQMFPNSSFSNSGPSQEFLNENNCLLVTVWKPHNQLTEKLVPVTPYIENSTVYTVQVESLSPEEIAANTQSEWALVRNLRDKKLAECDWTQLADVPINAETKTAWTTYRQELRDITKQLDPYNIVWPKAPNTVDLPISNNYQIGN